MTYGRLFIPDNIQQLTSYDVQENVSREVMLFFFFPGDLWRKRPYVFKSNSYIDYRPLFASISRRTQLQILKGTFGNDEWSSIDSCEHPATDIILCSRKSLTLITSFSSKALLRIRTLYFRKKFLYCLPPFIEATFGNEVYPSIPRNIPRRRPLDILENPIR